MEVYRENQLTPKRGEGLNRECIATFTNGQQYLGRCGGDYGRVISKLRKVCEGMDCELISFDVASKVWKVRVRHFTKLRFAMFD